MASITERENAIFDSMVEQFRLNSRDGSRVTACRIRMPTHHIPFECCSSFERRTQKTSRPTGTCGRRSGIHGFKTDAANDLRSTDGGTARWQVWDTLSF